eukprot:Sspe_Gene.68228::Locus_40257_Transcript_1_1_Confidence_1.000_Length_475::g.68228::m.68228
MPYVPHALGKHGMHLMSFPLALIRCASNTAGATKHLRQCKVLPTPQLLLLTSSCAMLFAQPFLTNPPFPPCPKQNRKDVTALSARRWALSLTHSSLPNKLLSAYTCLEDGAMFPPPPPPP